MRQRLSYDGDESSDVKNVCTYRLYEADGQPDEPRHYDAGKPLEIVAKVSLAGVGSVFEWEKRRTRTLCLRMPKARGVSMQLSGGALLVSSPSGSVRSPAAK